MQKEENPAIRVQAVGKTADAFCERELLTAAAAAGVPSIGTRAPRRRKGRRRPCVDEEVPLYLGPFFFIFDVLWGKFTRRRPSFSRVFKGAGDTNKFS